MIDHMRNAPGSATEGAPEYCKDYRDSTPTTPSVDGYDPLTTGLAAGYDAGFRDGHRAGYRAAVEEQNARHREAAKAVGAAIRLPVVTDMDGTDAELRERAAERERRSIATFRADHRARRPHRGLFDDLPNLGEAS